MLLIVSEGHSAVIVHRHVWRHAHRHAYRPVHSTCTDVTRIDMCVDTRVDMCVSMGVGMCVDMCAEHVPAYVVYGQSCLRRAFAMQIVVRP